MPLYIPIASGDSVVTSGYSSTFPEGIMVGKVHSFTERNDNFYNITVDLAVDFGQLSYVDVIRFQYTDERVALEKRKGNGDD